MTSRQVIIPFVFLPPTNFTEVSSQQYLPLDVQTHVARKIGYYPRVWYYPCLFMFLNCHFLCYMHNIVRIYLSILIRFRIIYLNLDFFLVELIFLYLQLQHISTIATIIWLNWIKYLINATFMNFLIKLFIFI